MKCSIDELQLMTEMFQSFPAYKKGRCNHDCLQAYSPGVKQSSSGEMLRGVTCYGKLQANLMSHFIQLHIKRRI